MFREVRRKDRELGAEEIKRIILNGEYGTLSTVNNDGYPYSTPLSYVYTDNAIYFHCALAGHKLDNIAVNSKVCFSVVGKTQVLPDQFSTLYESAVVFGKASVVEDPEEKRRAIEAIMNRYSPGHEEAGIEYIEKASEKILIVKIDIDRATGKGRVQ